MTDAFQRRDDGGLYEVTGIFQRRDTGTLYEIVNETSEEIELRAYDEGHTADGAGGIRLMCGEYVAHLTATSIAEIVTEAAV